MPCNSLNIKHCKACLHMMQRTHYKRDMCNLHRRHVRKQRREIISAI